MTTETTKTSAGTEFLTEAVADFTRAYMFMIGFGALHGEVTPVPHPGYWTSLFILFGVQAVAGVFKRRP